MTALNSAALQAALSAYRTQVGSNLPWTWTKVMLHLAAWELEQSPH